MLDNPLCLVPGTVIDIEYTTRSGAGGSGDRQGAAHRRWIRAEIIYCEAGTWPLARLADGQVTELRPFMPWRMVEDRSARRDLAA